MPSIKELLKTASLLEKEKDKEKKTLTRAPYKDPLLKSSSNCNFNKELDSNIESETSKLLKPETNVPDFIVDAKETFTIFKNMENEITSLEIEKSNIDPPKTNINEDIKLESTGLKINVNPKKKFNKIRVYEDDICVNKEKQEEEYDSDDYYLAKTGVDNLKDFEDEDYEYSDEQIEDGEYIPGENISSDKSYYGYEYDDIVVKPEEEEECNNDDESEYEKEWSYGEIVTDDESDEDMNDIRCNNTAISKEYLNNPANKGDDFHTEINKSKPEIAKNVKNKIKKQNQERDEQIKLKKIKKNEKQSYKNKVIEKNKKKKELSNFYVIFHLIIWDITKERGKKCNIFGCDDSKYNEICKRDLNIITQAQEKYKKKLINHFNRNDRAELFINKITSFCEYGIVNKKDVDKKIIKKLKSYMFTDEVVNKHDAIYVNCKFINNYDDDCIFEVFHADHKEFVNTVYEFFHIIQRLYSLVLINRDEIVEDFESSHDLNKVVNKFMKNGGKKLVKREFKRYNLLLNRLEGLY